MTAPVTWSHSGLKDFEGCARRYHAVKVLKLYPQMLELEQHQQTMANTDSELRAQVKAMIDAFRPTVASPFQTWDENDPLTKYDRSAVELNPHELMAVQAGEKPTCADWFDVNVFEQANSPS